MTTKLDADAYFDRVIILDGQGRRELSKDEFLHLPLSQRIRCVIERTAKFYAGIREIDRHLAIDTLRREEAR